MLRFLLCALLFGVVPSSAYSADTKISAMPNASTPLTGSEYLPLVQGGANVKTTAKALAGAALSVVTPEQYGAVGDAKTRFDGVISSNPLSYVAANATGTGATATAPSVTTTANNSEVISIFVNNSAWSSAPSGNVRANVAYASTKYGLYLVGSTKASPGATSPVSGTTSSSTAWLSYTVALPPSVSSSTFVSASTAQVSSGATTQVTAPSNISSDNLLFACVAFYDGSNTFTLPSGWTAIYQVNSGSDHINCAFKFATGSEPSTYSFSKYSGTGGTTVAILNYSGVLHNPTTLTSASAPFSAGSVGKPICVEKANGSAQACGTISGYNSASSVSLSFAAISQGGEFAFGTDDTTAFTTMLSSAPCSTVGCKIALGPKHYALTGSLTLVADIPVTISGVGPGITNSANSFINSNVPPNASAGTQLHWLTKGLSSAALSISGSVHVTSTVALDSVRDLAIVGGVGYSRDGGGADGVDILNWQGAALDNVIVFGFVGYGVYIDGLSASDYRDYIENIGLRNSVITYNYSGGLKIGSTTGVYNLESLYCDGCIIEANGGPGVILSGANIQGLRIVSSTIQWNNINSANPEILTSGTVGGGIIAGNYFEADPGLGSQSTSPFGNTAGMIGISYFANWISPSATYTPLTFSAAGTPLPTCSQNSPLLSHTTARVSDATACTNGTTYTSGGSTRCLVTCSGGAWVETGAGGY